MKYYIILYYIICFIGCSSIQEYQKLDPTKVYRMDLSIEADNMRGDGFLVIDSSPETIIKIESPGKINRLEVSTCHRHEVYRGKKDTFKLVFKPTKMEIEKRCSLKMIVFEGKAPQRMSEGFIDFKYEEGLGANFYCNGLTKYRNGVGICRSKVGLLQKIVFEQKVEMATPKPECKISLSKNKTGLEFEIRKGKCVYAFQELGGQGRLFRLTTIGYEDVAVRVY